MPSFHARTGPSNMQILLAIIPKYACGNMVQLNSHEDLVPEVALHGCSGDGGVVHADAGVVGRGLGEGGLHGGVGGGQVVVRAGGGCPVLSERGPQRRGCCGGRRRQRRGSGVGVHVAPPEGRRCGVRR